MKYPVRTGTMIALAAAGLFAAGCKKSGDGSSSTAGAASGEQVAKVHCLGVNDCKGKGSCHTKANACAGQNGCKGKGFIELTEKDCKGKGGTVLASD